MPVLGLAPRQQLLRSRRSPRRHTVVSVLLLAARFSFTTFVLSLAFWSMTSAISIVVLFLSRAPLWSSEAMWLHCFAGQQLLSIPLAWWRRRVLVRQRAEGRHLTQLELGLCYLQVHALVAETRCTFLRGSETPPLQVSRPLRPRR